LYSAGLSSTSVINLSLSEILKSRSMTFVLAWKDRRRPLAVRLFCRSCVQAGYVLSCSIATANRCAATGPHRKWSMLRLEKRCCETTVRTLDSVWNRTFRSSGPLWPFHRSCALDLREGSFTGELKRWVSFLAVRVIFICVYITNYLHFITMFLSF
jgi:hypothetical protein